MEETLGPPRPLGTCSVLGSGREAAADQPGEWLAGGLHRGGQVVSEIPNYPRSRKDLDLQVVAASTHAILRLLHSGNRSIAVHAVTAVRYCNARYCALPSRTITNANPATPAGEARTAAGFAVPGMTMPRLELFAQSFGAPAEPAGPLWRVIAGARASRAELAEVTR
jgi:hypothetical protein